MFPHHYGGHLADIPLPHRRMFDDRRRKRKVDVSIKRWLSHYHVSLHAENNPIWNSATKRWQHAWDDHECKSVSDGARFSTLSAANRWIKQTMAKKFPRCVAMHSWSDARWSPERPVR